MHFSFHIRHFSFPNFRKDCKYHCSKFGTNLNGGTHIGVGKFDKIHNCFKPHPISWHGVSEKCLSLDKFIIRGISKWNLAGLANLPN